MSQSSHQQREDAKGDTTSREQTLQMNPVELGQAANVNSESEMLSQLDTAAAMLENASRDGVRGDADADDGTTIEQYMSALLARTRGGGRAVNPMPWLSQASAHAERPSAPSGSQTSAGQSVVQSTKSSEGVATTWQHVAAPECPNAISELRELANISARSSFNVFRGRQLVYAMHNKLAVTLVASVVSAALTCLAHDARSPAFYAAIAAAIVAMCWAVQYFHLGRQLSQLCFAVSEEQQDAS